LRWSWRRTLTSISINAQGVTRIILRWTSESKSINVLRRSSAGTIGLLAIKCLFYVIVLPTPARKLSIRFLSDLSSPHLGPHRISPCKANRRQSCTLERLATVDSALHKRGLPDFSS